MTKTAAATKNPGVNTAEPDRIPNPIAIFLVIAAIPIFLIFTSVFTSQTDWKTMASMAADYAAYLFPVCAAVIGGYAVYAGKVDAAKKSAFGIACFQEAIFLLLLGVLSQTVTSISDIWPESFWYLIGLLFVVSTVGVLYVLIRKTWEGWRGFFTAIFGVAVTIWVVLLGHTFLTK
jgi:hypothetical protein